MREALLGPKQLQDKQECQMGPEANYQAPGQVRYKPKCKTGGVNVSHIYLSLAQIDIPPSRSEHFFSLHCLINI